METKTGIIGEVNNLGQASGSNIHVDGERFGIYSPTEAGMSNLAPGMEVTFNWFEKGTYKNIKGAVTPTGNMGTPKAEVPKGAAGGNRAAANDFPIGPLDGRRNITRRDAIKDAVAFVNEYAAQTDTSMDLQTRTEHVLEAAKIFEAYAAGDTDVAEAEAAAEALAEPTAQ